MNDSLSEKSIKIRSQFGMSRTQYTNMKRKGLDPLKAEDVVEFKKQRKDRKAKVKKIQRKNYEASQLHMRTKGKARKSKHKKRTKGWQSGSSKSHAPAAFNAFADAPKS